MDDVPRSWSVFAIDQPDLTAMSASNLLCECESDAAAFWLGGVKRHKQVLSVGDTQAAVLNIYHEIRIGYAPSDKHRLGAIGQGCVDCIRQQIDKHLLELIGI